MAKSHITIPAIRRMTSGALLPDKTLVVWYEVITDDPALSKIRDEIEVFQNFVEDFMVSGREDLPSSMPRLFLDINLSYAEDRGILKLMKGACVSVQDCHPSNAGRTLASLGVATGYVRLRRKDYGCVTFTTLKDYSNQLWLRVAPDPMEDFNTILTQGYIGRKPVKVNGKSV